MQHIGFGIIALMGLALVVGCNDSSSSASKPDAQASDQGASVDGDVTDAVTGRTDAQSDGGGPLVSDAATDAAAIDSEAVDAGGAGSQVPTCAEIMTALGAEGLEGASADLRATYGRTFRRLDANGDSVVTVEEYIASGHFAEMQARLIFAATDRDQNGEVTEQEYVDNRIITDEAKTIFEGLDTNADGVLREAEFVESAPFPAAVSSTIYGYFDTDENGEVMVPEYLRVWGAWARGERCP